MSQEEFAASLSPVKIPDIHKADLKTEVNEQRRTALRAVLGALQWHATNAAPWLSASVSILQG